jgi:hypothetical protein
LYVTCRTCMPYAMWCICTMPRDEHSEVATKPQKNVRKDDLCIRLGIHRVVGRRGRRNQRREAEACRAPPRGPPGQPTALRREETNEGALRARPSHTEACRQQRRAERGGDAHGGLACGCDLHARTHTHTHSHGGAADSASRICMYDGRVVRGIRIRHAMAGAGWCRAGCPKTCRPAAHSARSVAAGLVSRWARALMHAHTVARTSVGA